MKKFLLILAILGVLAPIYAVEPNIGVEVTLGSGIKPILGIDLDKVYTGLVIETKGPGLFASLGLGGAVKINTARSLGSNLLFRVSVGVGYKYRGHRVSVVLDHVSNANLASHNPGLDTIGIRYGYEF